MGMLLAQRLFAEVKFRQLFASIHGEAFESFFNRVMELRYRGYVPVRTHGNLGDMGADGISLCDHKLYACYAPEVFDLSELRRKFNSDVKKAIQRRPGEFDTFVFVHNDRRDGIHPEVSVLLDRATRTYAPILFDQMGPGKILHELMRLDKVDVEMILGCDIPVERLAYGIGIEDLAPLLEHLEKLEEQPDRLERVPAAGAQKIEFNCLCPADRDALVEGMRYTTIIGDYYSGRLDPFTEDQVAAGFAAYYRQVRNEVGHNTEEIMYRMYAYVHGNMLQKTRTLVAGRAIVAYFFERCHILETPPPGWGTN